MKVIGVAPLKLPTALYHPNRIFFKGNAIAKSVIASHKVGIANLPALLQRTVIKTAV